MKLKEMLNTMPEDQRETIIADLRKAKSAAELADLAKKHGLNIDAEAVFAKHTVTGAHELDDDELEAVAGGASCDSENTAGCACSAY